MTQTQWVNGIMVICGLLSAAGLIIAGLYYLLDRAFAVRHQREGRIVATKFEPVHPETRPVMVGNAVIPLQTRVPNQWHICVEVPEGEGWTTVRGFEDWMQPGDPVLAEYTVGRINGRVRVRAVKAINELASASDPSFPLP
jgi:hypothetical protein